MLPWEPEEGSLGLPPRGNVAWQMGSDARECKSLVDICNSSVAGLLVSQRDFSLSAIHQLPAASLSISFERLSEGFQVRWVLRWECLLDWENLRAEEDNFLQSKSLLLPPSIARECFQAAFFLGILARVKDAVAGILFHRFEVSVASDQIDLVTVERPSSLPANKDLILGISCSFVIKPDPLPTDRICVRASISLSN